MRDQSNERNNSLDATQFQLCARDSHSPDYSESNSESTSCMFSGKKRRKNLNRSATKQRYLKTNSNSKLDFSVEGTPDKPKTKKQYWTEEEVSLCSYFSNGL